jgi:soluble lytic murein transglycosylase-like protein
MGNFWPSRHNSGGVIAIALLLAASSAAAEIYKYRDAAGNLYFTDLPRKKGAGYDLLWRSGNDPLYKTFSRINVSGMEANRKRYSPLIEAIARSSRLRPALLHAVVRAESAYDPKALSRSGAQGLMQLMPATADRYGVKDSWNPAQNLDGGARYLHDLLVMFDYDLQLALAAYNAGENAVKRYGNKIPPYPETQNYVRKVVAFYRQGS